MRCFLVFCVVVLLLQTCAGVTLSVPTVTLGDESNPAMGCNDVMKNRGGWPATGVYFVRDFSNVTFKVLCDFTLFPGRAVALVYKLAPTTTSPSATTSMLMWTNANSVNEASVSTTYHTTATGHYVNRLLKRWSTVGVASLQVWKTSTLRQYINFNATGSTMTNWFTAPYVTSSSWTDVGTYTYLNSDSNGDYFAMQGQSSSSVNRQWFINKNYGGCANDAGYLARLEIQDGCTQWANYGQYNIIYSTTTSFQKRTANEKADSLAIFAEIADYAVCQNGALDATNSTCKCNSGWAGPRCQCPAATPDKLKVNNNLVMVQDAIKYENNTLTVLIKGPMVETRTIQSVTFGGASSSMCSWTPSSTASYWSRYLDSCEDLFFLNMAWRNKTACGWTVFSNSTSYLTYSNQITVLYSESLGNFSVAVTRSLQSSFNVYVSFPTTFNVTLGSLNVQSSLPVDLALTRERYIQENRTLFLEITAYTPYSGMLGSTSFNIFPPTGVTSAPVVVDGSACTSTPGSSCVQRLSVYLTLTNSSSCTFDGVFGMNATMYACRENGGAGCTSSPVTISFELSGGSMCTSVSLAPKVDGYLQPYSSSNFAGDSVSSYELGQQVFFYLNVLAGTGNAVSVQFLDIKYDYSSATSATVLMNQTQLTTAGSKVTLIADNINRYFSLYLTGAVFPSISTTFNFYAKCAVTYPGNKKRTIDLAWQQNLDNSRGELSEFEAKSRITVGKRGHKNKSTAAPNTTACDCSSITDNTTHKSTNMTFSFTSFMFIALNTLLSVVVTLVGVYVYNRLSEKKQSYLLLQEVASDK